MDRFIVSVIQKLRYIQIYLKSNMDRFIALTTAGLFGFLQKFKIQYG